MDVDNYKYRLKRHSLAIILIALGYQQSAIGVEFDVADINVEFNSKLTVGSSWRVENQDPSSDSNNADSDKNYEKGDAFTQIIKGKHSLKMQYKNVGFVVKGKYWYDYAAANNDVLHGGSTNGFTPNAPLNLSNNHDLVQERGIELLDAYVFAGFDIGNTIVDLRLGKQVVNWGESSLISGGINTINPIDTYELRSPGGGFKNALIPVNMAYANIGLTAALSVESFYQLRYEESAIANCGSYFSNNDFLSEGCDTLLIPPLVDNGASLSDEELFDKGAFVVRGTDEDVSDDGQFGVAVKYRAAALNDTLIGLYYLNYHSRAPVASLEVGTTEAAPSMRPKYHAVYPEDIQLIGLSFNTSLKPWVISGEVSHRLDMPLQINGGHLIQAALGSPPNDGLADKFAGVAQGETIAGFDLYDYTQAQVSFMRFFNHTLGANRIILIGELGYGHIWELDESADAIKYGRAAAYKDKKNDGYATSDSAGYRLALQAYYRDVYKGINLKPALMWSHDVYGYSPSPGATFMEGRTTAKIAITADYLNIYSASVSYSALTGEYNPIANRDFVSANVSISF